MTTFYEGVGPALPVTLGEREFLAGDGSFGAALAGHHLRFVYCDCGETPKAEDWHDHLVRNVHEAIAFERPTDYRNDCMAFLEDPA